MENNLNEDGTFPIELSDTVNGAKEIEHEAYKALTAGESKVRGIQQALKQVEASENKALLQDDLTVTLQEVNQLRVNHGLAKEQTKNASALYGGVSL